MLPLIVSNYHFYPKLNFQFISAWTSRSSDFNYIKLMKILNSRICRYNVAIIQLSGFLVACFLFIFYWIWVFFFSKLNLFLWTVLIHLEFTYQKNEYLGMTIFVLTHGPALPQGALTWPNLPHTWNGSDTGRSAMPRMQGRSSPNLVGALSCPDLSRDCPIVLISFLIFI